MGNVNLGEEIGVPVEEAAIDGCPGDRGDADRVALVASPIQCVPHAFTSAV